MFHSFKYEAKVCLFVVRWYADLCPRESEVDQLGVGPTKISLLQRVAPKLLKLMWDGFPLHYDSTHGWGYIIPGKDISDIDQLTAQDDKENGYPVYPLQ